jgi:hypothetical protein
VNEDDNSIWLETLAGRSASDANHPAAREAQLLRESISRRTVTDGPLVGEDARREAELISRAEREGLISPARHRTHSRHRPVWKLAAAAVLAMVAISLFWYMRPMQQEIVRGSHDGVVIIVATNPTALRDEIVKELRAVGVAATTYSRLGMEGIDADLPQPVSAPLREVLDKHHIPVPTDGVLKVEIASPADTEKR